MLTLIKQSQQPPELTYDELLEAEEYRRSFKRFAIAAWHVIEPSKPLLWNWHLDAIVEHLQALYFREITRLLVNIQPGTAKSTFFSIMFPAWCFTNDAAMRWLCASHSLDLAIRDNKNCRDLIQSEWYQQRYGHLFSLKGDQNVKSYFETSQRGYRMAVAVRGSGTGKRCDASIIDDPNNAMSGLADQQATIDWFEKTWIPRHNDQEKSPMAVVGQRLGQNDLSQHILELGGWEHLNLPTEFEPGRRCYTSVIGDVWKGYDPREEEGELLWEDKFSRESVEKTKANMGTLEYHAQYQQSPVPPGGYVFEKQYERLFSIDQEANVYLLETPDGIKPVVISGCKIYITSDVAAKAKEKHDFTVFCVWAITPRKEILLLYVIRAHLTITKQPDEGYKTYQAYLDDRFQSFWFEDVAYQGAFGQYLMEKGVPCEPFYPKGDKVVRAGGAAIQMKLGNVYFLKNASWLETWRKEIYLFPQDAHDDQCILPDALLPYIPHDDIISSYVSRHVGDKAMLIGEAQNLKEGDLVVTHTGKWQKIVHVISRSYQGEMVVIKPQGGFELSLTPEHPVFCVKRTGKGQFWKPRAVGEPQWIPASEVVPGDSVLEAIDQTITPVEQLDLSEWLLAERSEAQGKRSHAGLYLSRLIVEPDVIRFNNPRSHPIKRFVQVDGDLCRLMGYYVAEGSRGKHNVQWSFNVNETEYHVDVTNLLQSKFGIAPSIQKAHNSLTLAVSSWVLHDFFAQFGRGAKNKIVPQWIMHLPHNLQVEFLKGAWRGDGCVATDGSGLIYCSSSRELVVALRMILYRLGIVASMGISRPNGTVGHSIRGRAIKLSSPLYMLKAGGEYAPVLASLLDMPINREHIQNGRVGDRIVDGYVHRRVRKVEFVDYEGPVYNFEVEEDHSYQTESFIVHNCDNLSMIVIIVKMAKDVEPMDQETANAIRNYAGY